MNDLTVDELPAFVQSWAINPGGLVFDAVRHVRMADFRSNSAMIDLPYDHARTPSLLEPEPVNLILGAVPAGQPWLFDVLLWRTALRQADARNLEWRDLQFDVV